MRSVCDCGLLLTKVRCLLVYDDGVLKGADAHPMVLVDFIRPSKPSGRMIVVLMIEFSFSPAYSVGLL
uniref:Putative secreted protein n=1 Tax=Anopheles marajoara TaxID=58244 RepID=A0A2M4CF86_9DIPT